MAFRLRTQDRIQRQESTALVADQQAPRSLPIILPLGTTAVAQDRKAEELLMVWKTKERSRNQFVVKAEQRSKAVGDKRNESSSLSSKPDRFEFLDDDLRRPRFGRPPVEKPKFLDPQADTSKAAVGSSAAKESNTPGYQRLTTSAKTRRGIPATSVPVAPAPTVLPQSAPLTGTTEARLRAANLQCLVGGQVVPVYISTATRKR
jgi:hypothetical protein